MNLEQRIRFAIGELFIQLQLALSKIGELEARIKELEPNKPGQAEQKEQP